MSNINTSLLLLFLYYIHTEGPDGGLSCISQWSQCSGKTISPGRGRYETTHKGTNNSRAKIYGQYADMPVIANYLKSDWQKMNIVN